MCGECCLRLCECRGTCIERDLRCFDECDDADDDESVDDARDDLFLLCNESFGGGGIVGFFGFDCDVTFNGGVSKDVSCNVLGGESWRSCKGGHVKERQVSCARLGFEIMVLRLSETSYQSFHRHLEYLLGW